MRAVGFFFADEKFRKKIFFIFFFACTHKKNRVSRKPVWGTCAGLIILAETANRTKKGGQDLIGGLDVSVARNHFGRQVESFVADLQLPFLLRDYNGADGGSDAGRQTDDSQTGGTSATKAAATTPPPPPPASSFRGIFIRAPVVERILRPQENAERGEDGEARPGADADGRRRRRSGGEHMNGVEGKKEAKKEEEEEEEEGRGVVHAPPRQPKDAAASELARESVEVLATLPGRTQRQQPPPPPPNNGQGDQVRAHDGDVIAVKQGNVFGTSFHPELSGDARIHLWWLEEALKLIERQESSHGEE
jgi:glutamine amidotransferase PdxT